MVAPRAGEHRRCRGSSFAPPCRACDVQSPVGTEDSHEEGERDEQRATAPEDSTSGGGQVSRTSREGLPQLAMPSLADVAGEAVDSASLSFLLAQSLAVKEKKEKEKLKKVKKVKEETVVMTEEERAAKVAEAAELPWRLLRDRASSSSSHPAPALGEVEKRVRRKKKRRRKRTRRMCSGRCRVC